MPKQHGRIVNLSELTEILGVTGQTVRNWRRAGCPVEVEGGKGRSARFNTAHVIAWRLAVVLGETADLPLDEARRRKIAAEAQLAELQLDVKRGELAPMLAVMRHVEEAFGGYKKAIMAMPARYGAQIAAEIGCDIAKLDSALTKAIRAHLNELSAPVVRSTG